MPLCFSEGPDGTHERLSVCLSGTLPVDDVDALERGPDKPSGRPPSGVIGFLAMTSCFFAWVTGTSPGEEVMSPAAAFWVVFNELLAAFFLTGFWVWSYQRSASATSNK